MHIKKRTHVRKFSPLSPQSSSASSYTVAMRAWALASTWVRWRLVVAQGCSGSDPAGGTSWSYTCTCLQQIWCLFNEQYSKSYACSNSLKLHFALEQKGRDKRLCYIYKTVKNSGWASREQVTSTELQKLWEPLQHQTCSTYKKPLDRGLRHNAKASGNRLKKNRRLLNKLANKK
jgi:hypothetical protein